MLDVDVVAVGPEAELLGEAEQDGLLLHEALIVLDQARGVLVHMDAVTAAL